MENFKWTEFTRKIAVKSSISKLYDAWTRASEIEKWFLSNADYFDPNHQLIDKQTVVKKGYTYAWSWYTYDVVEEGKITEANGKDFIQFTFAGDCLVDVHFYEKEGETVVELCQKNIPTDDASKRNIRLGCDTGWSFFLVNLKSVYESGHDLRNKNDSLKGMVNS